MAVYYTLLCFFLPMHTLRTVTDRYSEKSLIWLYSFFPYCETAYRKTATRDPSGILQKPENRDPSGALRKPENRDPSGTPRKPENRDPSGTLRKPENWDPSGTLQKPENRDSRRTLKKPGIIYDSISFKMCKVNINGLSLSFWWSLHMHFTNKFHSFHKTTG